MVNREGEMRVRESMEAMRAELLQLLREKSYEEREVTLASGKRSNFYVDGKQTALHPRGAYLIGHLFAERLAGFGAVEAVGGPTLGADPLATATSLATLLLGRPLPAFIVRKEPKGHGTQHWIEGSRNLRPGANVVMLEDVVTTGGSSLRAVDNVESEGYRVLGILALVDRQEGGRETIEGRGLRFESLFGKAEIRGK